MSTHTLIDADGEVVCVLTFGDDAALALNMRPGTTAVAGRPPTDDAYRAGGAWFTRPARPGEHHTWNVTTKVWGDLRTPAQATADKWTEVRTKRDNMLLVSDWRPVHAADRGGQVMAQWAQSPWRDYRQALRDITTQPDPFAISWPTPPV